MTASLFAGAYVSKFSSGGRIYEDNGGLPLPDAYQVSAAQPWSVISLLALSSHCKPTECCSVAKDLTTGA